MQVSWDRPHVELETVSAIILSLLISAIILSLLIVPKSGIVLYH